MKNWRRNFLRGFLSLALLFVSISAGTEVNTFAAETEVQSSPSETEPSVLQQKTEKAEKNVQPEVTGDAIQNSSEGEGKGAFPSEENNSAEGKTENSSEEEISQGVGEKQTNESGNVQKSSAPAVPGDNTEKPQTNLPQEGFVSGEVIGRDGQWYVKDAKIQDTLTDVIQYNGEWYNVVKGKLTAGPSVEHNRNGWWYIDENGKVDFRYNGIASNRYGTWYLKNGKVDFGYNGFVSNKDGIWYAEKGKISFHKTDVIYDSRGTADGSRSWYNVVDSKVTAGPTVARNVHGWWYIDRNGKVDFRYYGFAPNRYGTWYLENGKVTFRKTDVIYDSKGTADGSRSWYNVVESKVTAGPTVAHNSNGWWYIDRNGKVDFGYNGFAPNRYGTWYLENGKVTFRKTDVIYDSKGTADGSRSWYNVVGSKVTAGPTVAHNRNGWWYIDRNGKVDFGYNDFAKNRYGTWYLENGKVTFGKTDVIYDSKGTVDGSRSWYNVAGSKVTAGPTVAHNSHGWWYIGFNCKVDFRHNGVEHNAYGWWKITNGKVDFSFHGVASNANGIWYLNGGKVDFSFNGTYDGYRFAGGKAMGQTNIVLVLDPGHDAKHTGATGCGVHEEVVNFQIAAACRDELKKYANVTVLMTHDTINCPLPSGGDTTDCLAERNRIATKAHATALISFHNDWSSNASAHGASVLCPSDRYNALIGKQGQDLGKSIKNQLIALGLADRGMEIRFSANNKYPDGSTADYYSIVRRSKLAGYPGIIIEHAFLSNQSDTSKYLATEEKCRALGKADAKGIAEYYNLHLK